MESWICPAAEGGTTDAVSLVSRDDVPVFRVANRATSAPSGGRASDRQAKPCMRRVDDLPTGSLDAGYVLRARPGAGAVLSLPVPFVVSPEAPLPD